MDNAIVAHHTQALGFNKKNWLLIDFNSDHLEKPYTAAEVETAIGAGGGDARWPGRNINRYCD